MYPYFVHAKFQVNWLKGYRVTGVRRITGPHGQLGHFTQSQFSGDLVLASLEIVVKKLRCAKMPDVFEPFHGENS